MVGDRQRRLEATRCASSSRRRATLSRYPRSLGKLYAASRVSAITSLPRITTKHCRAGAKRNRVDALCTEPVAPWRIHDLRRTTATHLRSIGIDRLVVSKILNHAEAGITRIYDRYSADPEKAAAMERWANRLREIVENKVVENVVALQRLSQ